MENGAPDIRKPHRGAADPVSPMRLFVSWADFSRTDITLLIIQRPLEFCQGKDLGHSLTGTKRRISWGCFWPSVRAPVRFPDTQIPTREPGSSIEQGLFEAAPIHIAGGLSDPLCHM